MNWARYKLLLVSGIASLIVSLGLIFWILSSRAATDELEQSIQTLEQQQERLRSTTPYPSEPNLTALRGEQQNVEDRRDKIKSVIREGQITAEPVRRSVFGDYVNDVVPELREAAAASTKGGEDGVIIKDPDFGMTDFLEGTLPPQQQINELVVEIETIKHVALLLFQSGISELITIKTVDEDEAAAERTPGRRTAFGREPTRRTTRQNNQGNEGEQEGLSDVEKERDRLFDAIHLKAEFKVYEDFLWETLNEILADPNQLVITSISITNGNTLLWPDYLKNPYSSAPRATNRDTRAATRRTTPENDLLSMLSGEQTETPEPEEDEKMQLGLPARQQNIVGQDLLNVVMELKAFRLKTEEESATQPEGI